MVSLKEGEEKRGIDWEEEVLPKPGLVPELGPKLGGGNGFGGAMEGNLGD